MFITRSTGGPITKSEDSCIFHSSCSAATGCRLPNAVAFSPVDRPRFQEPKTKHYLCLDGCQAQSSQSWLSSRMQTSCNVSMMHHTHCECARFEEGCASLSK